MASASSEGAFNDTPAFQGTKKCGMKLKVTQSQDSDLITVEAESTSPQVPQAPKHTRKRKRRIAAADETMSSPDSDAGHVTPVAKRRRVARKLIVEEKLRSAKKQAEAAQLVDAAEDKRKQVSQSDFFTSLDTHAHLVTPINLLDSPLRAKRGELTRLPCCVRFLFGTTARGKGVDM